MRDYNMDLVRVTESAAINAARYVGSGDKLTADKAATDAMRKRLDSINFKAEIIIGEGKKDESYGLFNGDMVGALRESEDISCHEIAVDPIDGTRPTVNSGPGAVSVMAIAKEKNSLYHTEEFYMNKLAYGRDIFEKVQLNINEPLSDMVNKISKATGKSLNKLMVCVMDRPRHSRVITDLRELGVRIKLIRDCDVSAAIAACLPDKGIDLLYGVGGAPESVIAAAAIKCLGGDFQSQVAHVEDSKATDFTVSGPELGLYDLVKGECSFVATGITDGSLLEGVKFTSQGPVTNSVFMRSQSQTVRWIKAYHGNDG